MCRRRAGLLIRTIRVLIGTIFDDVMISEIRKNSQLWVFRNNSVRHSSEMETEKKGSLVDEINAASLLVGAAVFGDLQEPLRPQEHV
jgi:hypothetical protein